MFNFDLALDIEEGRLSRADDLALELEQEITERLGVAVSEVRIEDDGSVGFSVEAADAVAQEKVLADLRAALVDGGTIGGFDVVAVVALHPPSPPPPSPPPCVTEGGMVLSEDAVGLGAVTCEGGVGVDVGGDPPHVFSVTAFITIGIRLIDTVTESLEHLPAAPSLERTSKPSFTPLVKVDSSVSPRVVQVDVPIWIPSVVGTALS